MNFSAGVCLCLALGWLFFGALPTAQAATITIDSDCPLKAAITAANNDSNSHDTDCTAGSGADTIVFASGSADTHYVNPGAALDTITTPITIEGAGKEIQGTATGSENLRIFNIGWGGRLTIKGLKVGYGRLSNTDNGAGIYIGYQGEAILIGAEITENNSDNRGGGIGIGTGGKLTVTNSRIHNNGSNAGGGGIYVESNGQATISGSSIYSNTAPFGAGVYVGGVGRLTVSNSTIAENNSSSGSGNGGGVYMASGGSATLSHVTVYGNEASASNLASQMLITGASTSAAIRNSVVCDDDSGASDLLLTSGATLSQNVGNVIGQGSAPTTASCANWGSLGTPKYYSPPSGDGALGIGNDAICKQFSIDQAGVRRPASGCDAGAVERGGFNDIYLDATCDLDEAINNANWNNQGNTDCEAGVSDGGAIDTIILTQDITLNASPTGVADITIVEGNGHTISIAAGTTARAFLVETSRSLTVRNITISGGANDRGGAIYSAGDITLEDCVIKDNVGTNEGGGFYHRAGTATVTRCVFQNNSGSGTVNGGGIFLQDGTLTVSQSSFINNSATDEGGGIYMNAGTLTVSSSTFSENSSTNNGGAIYIDGGTATLAHLTAWNNTSGGAGAITGVRGGGTTNMYNTIIGRDATTGGALCGGSFQGGADDNRGIILSQAYANCPAAIVGDPKLGAQTGAIPYLPLQAGSAAIRKGLDAQCANYATDQSGASRPASNCDIGAVEFIRGPASAAVVASGGGGGPPPAAIDCTGDWLNATTNLRLRASYSLCHGIQFQRVGTDGIGMRALVDNGFLDAVDVWGWARPTVEVCFPQAGKTLFIDSASMPRAVSPLASFKDGSYTCARVGRAGTIALMAPDSALGDPPADTAPGPLVAPDPPAAAAGPVPEPTAAPSTALTNCMVRTRAILNLREAPNGAVVGLVPWEAWLTAFSFSQGWYYIDYHGERGWISADYVEPRGDFCG